MPIETISLGDQLDSLLQSLQNQEIGHLTSACSRQVVSLAQISIYLKYGFEQEFVSNLASVLPLEQDELWKKTENLKSTLVTINKTLTQQINSNRDLLVIKKDETKKMLRSYCKLATLLDRSIDDQVKQLQDEINKMTITYFEVDPNIETFDQVVAKAKEISVIFKEQANNIEVTLKGFISNSMPNDFIERITQPQGIKLSNLDLKTLKDLYDTKMKDILRLTLSE